MKPSPKTIFVGSRSETGYETGYGTEPRNDLFEAGLKPRMKPQNSNQGFSGFLVGGAPKATWCGVFGPRQNNNHANTEQLTDYGASDSYETVAQNTSLQLTKETFVSNDAHTFLKDPIQFLRPLEPSKV